eukprot:CAMPEP_0181040716 /NCGR_PEP_ID=MMETSP1070-20121207/11202_1 /TAXON_ID=265543 /ORGANISM="Minutocellus polymorphus, Strain NH13" /LENGTH=456 /DNA_ID=CAMNT_0023118755 /DNA_START=26 /DNA_END=1397 /DNA_ORIENTATION=+
MPKKRKHQALDDLKAADILTNLVGVPRVGEEEEDGEGGASGTEAAAAAAAAASGATPAKKKLSGTTHMPPLDMDEATAQAIAASAVDIATGGDGDVGNVKSPGERQSTDPRFKQFHEDRWDYMLSEMLEFREANGHCLVPHTFPANPQLARWVKRQRRQYKLMNNGKTSTMTPERAHVLELEGFIWDSHDAAWKEKIVELRKYRAQHGHTLVPSSYKPNPHLATWVKCQRRQYKLFLEGKSSAMNPKRIAELEKEGFVWEIRGGNHKGLKNAPPGSTGGAPLPTAQAAAASAMAAAKAAAAASAASAAVLAVHAHGHGRAPSMVLPTLTGTMPFPAHAAAAATAAAAVGVPPVPRPMPPTGMPPPMLPAGMAPPMLPAGMAPPMLPAGMAPPAFPAGYVTMTGTAQPPAFPVAVPPPAAAAAPASAEAATATSTDASAGDKKVANTHVDVGATASV